MRILILSAKTGGGHMRAAQALKAVINERDSEAVVEIIDALEYVNHYFNKVVVDGYKFSAMKVPKLYGLFYRAANKDNAIYKFMQKTNAIFAKKFIPLLMDFKPDAVVTTHPFPSIMFSRLREKGITNIPLISIITDFASHSAYINPCVSEYVVSSVQMVDELESLGIDRNTVHPVGIPIDPIFYKQDDNKAEHLKELGFNPELKTVLIMAGSFGVTDILKIYENINEIDLDFQIIVITGKNTKLFDAFNSILSCNENMRVGQPERNFDEDKEPSRKELKCSVTKPTKLIYFTDEVYKYMHIADLIITKPGGLTVSESLASCLPMALFKAIPGQETDNSEYLCNNNLAIQIKKSNAADIIYQLLKYPERLISMRESCNRLNNKDSALNVYDVIKNTVDDMHGAAVINSFDELAFEGVDLSEELDYTEISRLIREYEDKYGDVDFSDADLYEEEIEIVEDIPNILISEADTPSVSNESSENETILDYGNTTPME